MRQISGKTLTRRQVFFIFCGKEEEGAWQAHMPTSNNLIDLAGGIKNTKGTKSFGPTSCCRRFCFFFGSLFLFLSLFMRHFHCVFTVPKWISEMWNRLKKRRSDGVVGGCGLNGVENGNYEVGDGRKKNRGLRFCKQSHMQRRT